MQIYTKPRIFIISIISKIALFDVVYNTFINFSTLKKIKLVFHNVSIFLYQIIFI